MAHQSTIIGNFYTLCPGTRGGWCVFKHGESSTANFGDYNKALAEFNRLEALEAMSYAEFARGA